MEVEGEKGSAVEDVGGGAAAGQRGLGSRWQVLNGGGLQKERALRNQPIIFSNLHPYSGLNFIIPPHVID